MRVRVDNQPYFISFQVPSLPSNCEYKVSLIPHIYSPFETKLARQDIIRFIRLFTVL